MDYPKEPQNIISLCSGFGGIERGLELAGVKVNPVAYVEIEVFPVANLVAKMETGQMVPAPVWTNLKTFPAKEFCGKVHGITAGYPCFAGGELVLTKDGYKYIKDVVVGDKVLTHRGRWRTVISTMSKTGASTRRIIGQGFDSVECTAEHPFYTRERQYCWSNSLRMCERRFGQPMWRNADTITKDIFVGQVIPRSTRGTEYSEDFWWVTGRYIADGYRQQRKDRKRGGRVVIGVGKHKSTELEERLKREFGKCCVSEERTTKKFRITRNSYYEFTEQFGKYAHGKCVPGWVFSLPNSYLRAFIEGYLSGDGHKEKNCWRSITVSRKLAYGLSLVWSIVSGCATTIRYVKTPDKTTIEGRVVNQRDYYTVNFYTRNRVAFKAGKYIWKQIKSNRQYKRNRTVYNLEVEEDNSYTVNNLIVHNCQPFSFAGKRKGKEDPRHLWPYIREHIKTIQPVWCFFENVEGHLTMGFDEVYRSLRDLGYKVEAGIFSAAECGAPHQRKRLFILGYAGHIRPQERQEQTAGVEQSGEELGNAEHYGQFATKDRGSVSEEQEKGRVSELEGRCGEELADTKVLRLEEHGLCERPTAIENSEELADTEYERHQKKRRESNTINAYNRWPARPGEEQHDWEESRVLEDTSSVRRRGGSKDIEEHTRRHSSKIKIKGHGQSSDKRDKQGKIEPFLGRAVAGNSSRVDAVANRVDILNENRIDRLRLLGNGVVPQTAAKAWIELNSKFE